MMRVSAAVAIAVLAMLMTGCGGGGGEQAAAGAPDPASGDTQIHEIGPLMVQTEKTGKFKAEQIVTAGEYSFVALTGARINYLAVIAMMDRFVFASDRSGPPGLYICNFDGSGVTQITSNSALEMTPRWSPDGRKIAFVRRWPGQKERIYTINADGTGARALTDGTTDCSWPSWSPDGGQIAYMAMVGTANEVVVMSSADGSRKRNITNSTYGELFPAWSPDGTRILYGTNQYGSGSQLVLWGLGGFYQRVTDDTDDYYAPAWHPSGAYIAFQSTRHGDYEIELMRADGSGQRNFSSAPSMELTPRFTTDGRHIVYSSDRDGVNSVWLQETYLDPSGEPARPHDIVRPVQAWRITRGNSNSGDADPGSPTMQTQRVLIGAAGGDLFGNNPIWNSAPAAIVALGLDGYGSLVRIGVADEYLAGMQIKPLANPASEGAAVEVSATRVANLREDRGLGRAPQVWDLTALNSGMVLLYFNSHTGKLAAVIPIRDVAYTSGAGTASQAAPYSTATEGDGVRLAGAFAAVFDAEGRNLAPSGASSVRLSRDGQVLSAD